jgi:hypothetical protein
MKRLALVILVVLSLGVAANAQTFRGAINGTVTDPSGAVIPNAAVKATESATGVDHNTVTTSEGQFSFQDIPLGFYKVTVTASGFPVYTVDKVEVTAGMIYTLQVKLTMQQQATTVEVSAAALTLDTTTQTQSMTITSDAVADIPLNGRDFTQLIAVAPGYAGYSVGGFGSLNGTRANQMNWQIDGTDNNDFWHNIPAVNQGGVSGIAGVVLPVDAIDEFSAQTQSSAETGRNAGGTVNLVIKSGGNTLHGSAYYYNRNEFYGAGSPFLPAGTKTPRLRNENYGFTVGGPIIKNKTFFFLGFEKQDYIIGLSGLATEPSDAWITKATDLLNNPGNKYGAYAPVTPSSLSAILIGANGFWPRNVIGSLPATLNNFFSPVASTGYSYNGIVKLDHNFSDKHHLSARWFVGQGSQTAPTGGSPALGSASSNLKYYFEVAPIHVQNYSLVLNSAFTPKLTNQVLFGVNYFNQTFNDFNSSFDTKALGLFLSPDATIKGNPILGAASTAITGFEQVGITPPEGRNDITGHLTDIVSYNTGKHQFRFGAEVRQGRVNEFYHYNSRGTFTFDGTQGPWSATCGVATPPAGCTALGTSAEIAATEGLADFLSGFVQSSSISVGNSERFVTVNAFNFFGQDAWQITRKLSLNFGLRYEYFGPLHSDKKDLAVFVPGKGLVIQGNGIDSIFPPDKNNVAPRFGFAYQPTARGDLVVRGGIGVFYDQINMNPFLDYRPQDSGASGLEGNPAGPNSVSSYGKNLAGNTSYTWVKGQQIFPGKTTCSGNFATDPGCLSAGTVFNLVSVNQNFRAPYFFNYNLQVEKSLGNATVFQIGYVGSEGRKLSVMLDINQASLTSTDPNNATLQQRRPLFNQYPNFGIINQLNSAGTSNYSALQTTLRVRAWHGLSSQFAYTWGHALDEVSDYRHVLPQDSRNLKGDYGSSDFDTRHNFTANFTYAVPGSSHGPKILTHGWQVSSLVSLHTGQPVNIFSLTDSSSTNDKQQRPNLIGDPFASVSHKFSNAAGGAPWINPAAFAQPAPGTFGNLGRNKIYGPGYASTDLSVLKNIPITERVKVQLRAEMFNLFNRVNLVSGPGAFTLSGGGIANDTIGDFNGAPGIGPGEAFNMQLVAKIIF